MRRKLVIIEMLLLASLATVEAKEINMLFMGNSFTFRHNLPQLVKQVFEEGQPDLTVNVERIVYGGQDMFRHHDLCFSDTTVRLNSITITEIEEKTAAIKSMLATETPPAFYDAYWEKTGLKPVEWFTIQKNLIKAVKNQRTLSQRIKNDERVKWDYLVLQSWKDVVADVDSGYGEYAQKWAKLAEQEGLKVILYITAPHAQNQKPVTKPLELAQTKLELKAIQQLTKRIKPHAVVPVALGIKNIQQNGTKIKFRYLNDMHPNQYSAFLTANMFYAAFFKKSTAGFKFNTVVETKSKGKGEGKDPDGGDAKVVFDDTTKILLQKAAFDAVMEFNAGYGK
ncbi:hypothetical protein ACFL34_01155 [Candidatus Sumerlaeota bacterium]